MRLAVLLEQLLQPIPGGSGRYAAELAAALAATAEPGDTLTGWVARRGGAGTADAARIQGVAGPRQLPLPRQALNRLWPRTSRLPGTGPRDADVVFAPTPFAPPRARTPLVVAVHDAVAWTAPTTMSERSAVWHRRVIARALADADAVVVPTQATKHALAAQGLPTAKAVVTGEGVSRATAETPPDADARAARLQLPQRFLLAVGTLEPRKGLDIAMRALADESTQDVPLVVAGPAGWGGLDLRAEARAYGLAPDRVRVLGRISDADLATAYSRAAAVVVPSRDEGFGLPAVEAMAHGVTPLVSSAPALVEVVGDAGVVTPIGDRLALARAIGDVLDRDEDTRRAWAERARAQAARHTWAGTAERTWAVLRAVSKAATA